jgi:hypothetical protein
VAIATAAHHRGVVPAAAHRIVAAAATLATPAAAALDQLTHTLVHLAGHRVANPANTRNGAIKDISHRAGNLLSNTSDRLEAAVDRGIQATQEAIATILTRVYHST